MQVWRCDITGNPWGTDTIMIGEPCKCQGCRAAMEIDRLQGEYEKADEAAKRLGRKWKERGEALTKLCDEIVATEEHGDGAEEGDCPICVAIREARNLTK